MSGSSINFDMSKLNAFVKGLDDRHQVQVGIFGNKTNRTRKKGGTATNAEIGAIHEYGSFSRHIPARSFLRMPIHTQTKEILSEVKTDATLMMLAKGNLAGVLKVVGIACENAIQRAFASHGFGLWAADKPATVRCKGSDSPLIDTAQLRRSIDSRVVTIS